MEDLLLSIEIETADNPRYSVIWLHGLGADGSDFVPIVPELGLPEDLAVRFIFPHAPLMPVTCNGGYVMRAWYDIISLDSATRRIDEGGIVQSRAALRQLISRENERGVPCERIFLGGFSQGGAIVYTTALTHPGTLAGVLALSTYLPSAGLVMKEKTEANRRIPIFAAHGTEDEVVSLELGLQARDLLNREGYRVEWHEYRMSHSVCLEEIQLIGKWLQARMA